MHYEDIEYFEPAKDEADAHVRARETDGLEPAGGGGSGSRLHRARDATWAAGPWLPELACCAVGAAALAALAGVLARFDGRALPAAWPLGVTLNTLAAFLAAAVQAACAVPVVDGLAQLKWNWFARRPRPLADFRAFDDAGRGPYGCVKLLWTTRGRFVFSPLEPPTLLTLRWKTELTAGRLLGIAAAWVLVTGLVTSPLTQAAIAYPTRLMPGTGTATLARSDAYPPAGVPGGGPDLDARQKQAIQQGLFGAAHEAVAGVAPRCSSGECRWPAAGVSSLTVCVATADVSDRLNVTQTWDWTRAAQLGLPPAAALSGAHLPNGAGLVGGGGEAYNLNLTTARAADGGGGPAGATLAFADRADLRAAAIADLFVVYTNRTGPAAGAGAAGGGPVGFRAVEVLLHFCVATYRAAVTAGEPSTELTGTATHVLTTNGTPDGRLVLGTGSGNTARNYTVDVEYVGKLHRYVASTLAGTYSASLGSGAVGHTSAGDAYGTALYNSRSEGGGAAPGGDEWLSDAIFNVTSNVAQSLTNT